MLFCTPLVGWFLVHNIALNNGKAILDTRNRVVLLWKRGFKLKDIHERLKEKGINVIRAYLCRLIRKFKDTGSVRDNRTWKPPRILQDIYLRFIDNAMANDDELTSRKLYTMLIEDFRTSLSEL